VKKLAPMAEWLDVISECQCHWRPSMLWAETWSYGSQKQNHPKLYEVDGVRSEVLTAASMKMAVLLIVVPCNTVVWATSPDDGGSKHLWNVGKILPDYTTQKPRRRPSSYEVFLHCLIYRVLWPYRINVSSILFPVVFIMFYKICWWCNL
jgi:hypothetical protein